MAREVKTLSDPGIRTYLKTILVPETPLEKPEEDPGRRKFPMIRDFPEYISIPESRNEPAFDETLQACKAFMAVQIGFNCFVQIPDGQVIDFLLRRLIIIKTECTVSYYSRVIKKMTLHPRPEFSL
jgi:hypothetical protein